MTALTRTLADLQTELLRGGELVIVTGTATVWLMLVKRSMGTFEAWSVTP